MKNTETITSGTIAIDNGGHSTCVITKNGADKFYSVKGYYGDRKLTEVTGKYDFIVEYKGEKYVMGTLAKYDCKYPLQMHTKSKQHLFFDLSILVAIHQFGYATNYVITSVPIKMHEEKEKNGVIERLIGEHTLTVNGKRKKFSIVDCKVAPETAVAFWIKEPKGKSRFLDLGSRTIGYATTVFEDNVTRFIDTESGTMYGKGLEALEDDYDQKSNANSKGYKLQVRVLGESNDDKKIKHAFKNLENSFSLLDGDNKFYVTHVKTKRGIKSIIKAVEENKPLLTKTTDILYEKEINNIVRIPSKNTLKEYERCIMQDNFTRTEISKDFFDNGLL